MTPELAAQLGAAETLHALEDLYAPYKPCLLYTSRCV